MAFPFCRPALPPGATFVRWQNHLFPSPSPIPGFSSGKGCRRRSPAHPTFLSFLHSFANLNLSPGAVFPQPGLAAHLLAQLRVWQWRVLMLTWVLGGAPAVGAVRPGRDEVKEVGRPPPSRRGAAREDRGCCWLWPFSTLEDANEASGDYEYSSGAIPSERESSRLANEPGRPKEGCAPPSSLLSSLLTFRSGHRWNQGVRPGL